MGVVYYQYKSSKDIYSIQVPHAFISVSELKQLIKTSDKHGQGRTRGPATEDIIISNAQTGEEYTDERAFILQNTTVLVRRISIPGQLSEKIVLSPVREVTEGCSAPSSKSVVTDPKSCSFTGVQDEDAAIAAVIDAAQLNLEQHASKRGQGRGRHNYGHGPLEGETPPPGYVCRSCGVPGHFIQHCQKENRTPPPGYICHRCQIPGHFIHHCRTIGDSKFDNNKMSRSLAPVVTVSPVNGILEELVPAAQVSAVDDLPAELHCRLCKKVMIDAVLTSKCCFDSFCDKCIRDYIITESKCICGVMALADDLIPNHTLRSTISNMLGTRASSGGSGTTKHRSSSGSNLDSRLQRDTPFASSEREMKQSTNLQLSAASAPDVGLQIAKEGDQVNQPPERSAANVDTLSKDEGISAELSAEKAVESAKVLKANGGSGPTSNVSTISGILHNATRTNQPKKKRKKADSTKNVQPNNVDYGYNVPFDPAYYNSFVGGYPWVTEPYMYGSMGMPYGGYPMDPFGVNSFNGMPPQALAMQGYPASYQRPETQPMHYRGSEAVATRPRQAERPKDSSLQPGQSSERNRQLGSSHGSELRNRPRSGPERRDHGRSDRASDDYHEHHSSRKRVRDPSPVYDYRHSSQRSRHGSRSKTREDSSDDERNFKRRWGRRSSVSGEMRH